jgi:hypothetical protein
VSPGGPAAHAHIGVSTAGLNGVASARESRPWRVVELFDVWVAAAVDAREAYDAWRATPGRIAFTTYRAAQDRADAAQDRLANMVRSTAGEGR